MQHSSRHGPKRTKSVIHDLRIEMNNRYVKYMYIKIIECLTVGLLSTSIEILHLMFGYEISIACLLPDMF